MLHVMMMMMMTTTMVIYIHGSYKDFGDKDIILGLVGAKRKCEKMDGTNL